MVTPNSFLCGALFVRQQWFWASSRPLSIVGTSFLSMRGNVPPFISHLAVHQGREDCTVGRNGNLRTGCMKSEAEALQNLMSGWKEDSSQVLNGGERKVEKSVDAHCFQLFYVEQRRLLLWKRL